jgi:hypothetical protein
MKTQRDSQEGGRAATQAMGVGGRLLSSALGVLSLVVLGTLAGCKDDGSGMHGDNPPPPLPSAPAAGGSAKVSPCGSNGAPLKDAVSAAIFPQAAGGYCLDPNADATIYGDKEQHTMDEVCTKQFDGECEIYKKFGVRRVVTLRYIDGSGSQNSVAVLLDKFADAGGAYAMFTTRVVAGGDPAETTVKPLAAGAVGAVGSTNAYVWRGEYLVELSFASDDPSMTPATMTRLGSAACAAIGKAIGEKLPPAPNALPDLQALPKAEEIPLGVSYEIKDALGVTGLGAAAIGYYKGATKRYRIVSIVREDADHARDAMKVLKSRPGSLPMKDISDEAAAVTIQEAADLPKADYIFARKGNAIFGVGDEVLSAPKDGADKSGSWKLTRDEKMAKVLAWLVSPAPAGSASAAPSASAKGK